MLVARRPMARDRGARVILMAVPVVAVLFAVGAQSALDFQHDAPGQAIRQLVVIEVVALRQRRDVAVLFNLICLMFKKR